MITYFFFDLEIPKSLEKVCELTGKTLTFFEIDICDKNGLRKVFNQNTIDCVIHIAALKSVNEVKIIYFFKDRSSSGHR